MEIRHHSRNMNWIYSCTLQYP